MAVQNPALKLLASSLPDCIKHSKAKNTQVKYCRGFDRWRSWASKFTEVNVLPVCSIYIVLFVFKLIQDNVCCHIIDAVYYGIKWVHEIILLVTKILVILQLWLIYYSICLSLKEKEG